MTRLKMQISYITDIENLGKESVDKVYEMIKEKNPQALIIRENFFDIDNKKILETITRSNLEEDRENKVNNHDHEENQDHHHDHHVYDEPAKTRAEKFMRFESVEKAEAYFSNENFIRAKGKIFVGEKAYFLSKTLSLLKIDEIEDRQKYSDDLVIIERK